MYNPTISEDALLKLENAYGFCLPNEYRDFLKYIGNGGEPPRYGILSAEDALAIHNIDAMMKRHKKGEYNLKTGGLVETYLDSFEGFSLDELYNGTRTRSVHASNVDNMVFEDYIDADTNNLKFSSLKEIDFNAYCSYLNEFRKHMLIVDFYVDIGTEYGIVLDGKYKDEVVYFCQNIETSDVLFTHYSFLDWILDYYRKLLSCELNGSGWYTMFARF